MATTTPAVEARRSQSDFVWKFGYGSNMSQDNLRVKKGLSPLGAERVVLAGFALSFPEGNGIDFVEPSFATLKRIPDGAVHGVAAKLTVADAADLDRQEGNYIVELHPMQTYDGETIQAEVYVSQNLDPNHPEGCCSDRYRALLVRGAIENELADSWVQKLRNLPVYEPSAETIRARHALPSPGSLPTMTIAELALHTGDDESRPVYVSACGYIFEHTPIFGVMRGRDVTNRNVMHHQGMNLERMDDGGQPPFPKLSDLAPGDLEYALRYRDRFRHLCEGGRPVAVLLEFWEAQDASLDGVYQDNPFSKS